MAKEYNQDTDTPFGKKIRIKPAQLEWIKKHKGRYTLAGKLDEIINFYKNESKNKSLGATMPKMLYPSDKENRITTEEVSS